MLLFVALIVRVKCVPKRATACCIMCYCVCEGNDNLHLLTSGKRQLLRVDLADFEGDTSYAKYDNFRVGSASEKYRLASLGTYSGSAGTCRLRNCFVIM